MRIGIECGGTFTDYVALGQGGELLSAGKVFSTPNDPSLAVRAALQRLGPDAIAGATLVHGSTVATNALIERKGARIALVVTKGFRDLVFLQRQDRETMYDLRYVLPVPLVRREDIFEVSERIDAAGVIVTALDSTNVTTVIERLQAGRYDAVAVCLLHSYANEVHEAAVGKAIEQALPELHVSLSSISSGEFREYERTTTTTADAFLKPRISAYLGALQADADRLGLKSLNVMQSNGGMVPVTVAASLPLTMLRSGPAAGVAAAVKIAANAGLSHVVTMDMGGTSTDVAIIRDGKVEMTSETLTDGLPVRVPMVDIIAVGAGGGSIVGIDSGGLLTVGPQSAGADPGPIAYRRGGTQPTVTDANVVKGVIRPDTFLGGQHKLDVDAAAAALAHYADTMGRTPQEFVSDITSLVATHMAGAIRMATTERGHDVSDYALVAYGGAGGLHAADVADILGIPTVLIPPYCGMTSAYGLLAAGFRREFSRTQIHELPCLTDDDWKSILQDITNVARQRLAVEHITTDDAAFRYVADMRYRGQGYEVMVEAGTETAPMATVNELLAAFSSVHQRRYGYIDQVRPAQLVTIRVIVEKPSPATRLPRVDPSEPSKKFTRPISENGRTVAAAFVSRRSLRTADILDGPAVIEDDSSTIVVPTGWTGRIDDHTNVVLTRRHS